LRKWRYTIFPVSPKINQVGRGPFSSRARLLFTVAGLLLVLVFAGLWSFYSGLHTLAKVKRYDCQRPDLLLLQRLEPNCSGSHSSMNGDIAPFRTNSLGMLDIEHPPKGRATRVLLLGDSGMISFHAGPSLIELLRERLAKKGVELINGATPGFTLVQVLLAQRELLPALKPDIVVLAYSFGSMGLNTAFYHLISQSTDAHGLASQMGPIDYFWPIPTFLSSYFYYFPELRFLATKLRYWQELMVLRFGTAHATRFSAAKRDEPGLLDIVFRYLRAIEAEAKAAGADYYVIRHRNCRFQTSPGIDLYFKSEIAAQTHPLVHERFLELCRAGSLLPVAENGHEINRKPLAVKDGESVFIPGDIHLNAAGTRAFAPILERAILQALEHHREWVLPARKARGN